MLQHSIWQVGCGLSQAILEPFSSAWVKDKQGHLPGGNCFQVKKVRCPARGSKHFTFYCASVWLWAAKVFISYQMCKITSLSVCVLISSLLSKFLVCVQVFDVQDQYFTWSESIWAFGKSHYLTTSHARLELSWHHCTVSLTETFVWTISGKVTQ